MPLTDLLPQQIKRQPTIADLPAPPIAAMTPMGPIPSDIAAAPAQPDITVNPRMSTVSSDPLTTRASQLNADLYNRMNPIAPTTTLGKIGHVAANVGNVLGNIFAPDALALIPGTQLYNERIEARDKADLDQVSQLQTAADQRAGTEANTAYTQQRPAIEQAKIQQKITAANNKNAANVSKAGFVQTVDPDTGIATFDEDPDSQAYKDRVSLSAMHDATAEKDQIQSDIAQNRYVQGTPEYAEAQRRLAQVDKRLQLEMASLGLRREGLNVRERGQAAELDGIDPTTGKPFAGASIVADQDGGETVVGAKFAPGADKAQGSITGFNDLGSSIQHARGALQSFAAGGGQLSDPRIIAAMHSPESLSGKFIHGLVQQGLNPSEVSAITAMKQLQEQGNILRSATKGTSSEANAQRILETLPQEGDGNDVAFKKLDESELVRQRLAPGIARAAGGARVTGTTPRTPAPSQQVEEYVRDSNGKLVKKMVSK